MYLKLESKLLEKINEWMNENCEDFEIWPEIWVGERTDVLMTKAAAVVFDAVEDVQKYLKEEGHLDK